MHTTLWDFFKGIPSTRHLSAAGAPATFPRRWSLTLWASKTIDANNEQPSSTDVT